MRFRVLSQRAPSLQVPGSYPSCHQSMPPCHFCGHLSAPAAACRHQGTAHGPRCPGGGGGPATPCPSSRLLQPAFRRPNQRTVAANPRSQGHPPLSSPQSLPHSQGLLVKAQGPGTMLETPLLPRRGPRPSRPALPTSCCSPASTSSSQGLLFK